MSLSRPDSCLVRRHIVPSTLSVVNFRIRHWPTSNRTYRFGFTLGVLDQDVHFSFARGKRFNGEIRFGSDRRTGRLDAGTVNANTAKTT